MNNFCAFMSVTTRSLARRCTVGVRVFGASQQRLPAFSGHISEPFLCFSARVVWKEAYVGYKSYDTSLSLSIGKANLRGAAQNLHQKLFPPSPSPHLHPPISIPGSAALPSQDAALDVATKLITHASAAINPNARRKKQT